MEGREVCSSCWVSKDGGLGLCLAVFVDLLEVNFASGDTYTAAAVLL